jgi:hypothetical protein
VPSTSSSGVSLCAFAIIVARQAVAINVGVVFDVARALVIVNGAGFAIVALALASSP